MITTQEYFSIGTLTQLPHEEKRLGEPLCNYCNPAKFKTFAPYLLKKVFILE